MIVGAGLAGAKTAEALRDQGFDGEVILLGEEPDLPYDRPPLSKEYLQGNAERDAVFLHQPGWYSERAITLRTATTVSSIDRGTRRVELVDGEQLDYDKLLLATGSSPRQLPVPGADLDGVYYLRRVGDSDRLRTLLATAERIAIIGAGWIGLEVAAAARLAGVEVSVLETAALPLQRVLGDRVAGVFAGLHRDHGVDLHLEARVDEIIGDGQRVTGVTLAGGDRVDADGVVIGIGASPNIELAHRAGLAVDDGVLVDAALRSSDPDIYAAGDIARAYHPLLDTRIRVEHWANAFHQPTTAAAAMLGRNAEFDALPYFFTDQYDLGMEYTGYVEPDGYDQVVIRGDLRTREFIAFWLSQDRVLAGMNVNIWDVTSPIEALIRARTPVDTTRLADPAAPLDSLLPPGPPRP